MLGRVARRAAHRCRSALSLASRAPVVRARVVGFGTATPASSAASRGVSAARAVDPAAHAVRRLTTTAATTSTSQAAAAAAADALLTANGLADAERDLIVLDEIKRSDQLLQALSSSSSTAAAGSRAGAASTQSAVGQQNAMAQAKALLLRALDVVKLIPSQPPMRVNAGLRLARVHAWRAEFADETAERQRVLKAVDEQLRAAIQQLNAADADEAAAERAAALALLQRRCVLSLAYCHFRAGESVRVTQLLTHYASHFAAQLSATATAAKAAANGASASASRPLPAVVHALHAESAVWCRLLLAYSAQCSLLERAAAAGVGAGAGANKRDAVLTDLEGGVQFLITECERQCKQFHVTSPQLLAAIAIQRGALAAALATAATPTPTPPGASAGADSALVKRWTDDAVKHFTAAIDLLQKQLPDSSLLPSALCAVGMLKGDVEPLKQALSFSEKHYGSTDARVAVVLQVMARYYLKAGDPVTSEGLYRSALSYFRAHRPFTASVAYGYALASAEHSLRLLPRLTWNQRNRGEEGAKLHAQTRDELNTAFGGRSVWLAPASTSSAAAAGAASASASASEAASNASELSAFVAARNAGWLRQLYYFE